MRYNMKYTYILIICITHICDSAGKVYRFAEDAPLDTYKEENEENFNSDYERSSSNEIHIDLTKTGSRDHDNKILIKRLVTHGNYDDLDTNYYRPLFRIHRNPNSDVNIKVDQIYLLHEKNKKIQADDNLTQYFRGKPNLDLIYIKPQLDNQWKDLTKTLKNVIKKISYKSKRMKQYEKMVNLLKELELLRTGEHEHEHENIEPPEKNLTWFPYYPPWNYWTYTKNIHHDECPGDLMKVHNMCINLPPH